MSTALVRINWITITLAPTAKFTLENKVLLYKYRIVERCKKKSKMGLLSIKLWSLSAQTCLPPSFTWNWITFTVAPRAKSTTENTHLKIVNLVEIVSLYLCSAFNGCIWGFTGIEGAESPISSECLYHNEHLHNDIPGYTRMNWRMIWMASIHSWKYFFWNFHRISEKICFLKMYWSSRQSSWS